MIECVEYFDSRAVRLLWDRTTSPALRSLVDVVQLRVPDEFARRRKREVANVVGSELPRLLAHFGLFDSFALASSGVTMKMGFSAVASLLQSLTLSGSQYLLRILQDTGRGNEVVVGNGDRDFVVA